MLLKTVNDEQWFCATDRLDRSRFFYTDSTVRIVGWESAVSLLYCRDHGVCLRFKDKETAGRALREDELSSPLTPLTQEQLTSRLASPMLSREYVLYDVSAWLDSRELYWYPVKANAVAVLSPYTLETGATAQAELHRLDGVPSVCFIGFDGRFYSLQADGVYVTAELGTPAERFCDCLCTHPYPTVRAYRDYLAVGTACYAYDGRYLEEQSLHHRCCERLSAFCDRLVKRPASVCSERVRMTVALPPLKRVTRSLVMEVLLPALQAERAIDLRKRTAVQRAADVLDRAGICDDFFDTLERLERINRDRSCGGGGRTVCSKRLAARLETLARQTDAEGFAALLRDEDALRQALRALHDGNEGQTEWI